MMNEDYLKISLSARFSDDFSIWRRHSSQLNSAI